MRIQSELSGVNIVLRGEFRSEIFTPAWLALYKILSKSEAQEAKSTVHGDQATDFSTNNLRCNATKDLFQIASQSDRHIHVGEIVVRIFSKPFFSSTIQAFGINRFVHFRAPSPEARHHVGRTLAPVEPWLACKDHIDLDAEHGGLRSLTMINTNPTNRSSEGEIRVTVEPSIHIDPKQTGLFVNVNDHYVLGDCGNEQSDFVQLFKNTFPSSIQRSEAIVDHVMSLAEQTGS